MGLPSLTGERTPDPSATGMQHMDGNASYLCLRDTSSIRCLGQRSGDRQGAPPVWVGDLTRSRFRS